MRDRRSSERHSSKRHVVLARAGLFGLCLTAWAASNSPVADAAMHGDQASVRTLLQQKADVNTPQADGATAIQWAAYRNDIEMADVLIRAGADVRAANRDGATALSLASVNGNAALIEMLLKTGVNPNARGPTGETALMYASRNGNVDAIKVLLDHKADVNAKESIRGTTALMWAADQTHPAAVKLLAERGADVSAASNPDTKGNKAYLAPTPAQRAANKRIPARSPNAAAVRRSASGASGAKADEGDAIGPDDFATADAEAAAASFGRQNDTDGGGLTALVIAAREDCIECVRNLLEAGANVNQTTRYGWSALLTATQNRNYKLGAYLLERGADPNLANHGAWTPLYLAADNRNIESGDYPVRKPDMDHLDFIKLLIDSGAKVNTRICGVKSTPERCQGDSTETRTNFTMQWLYEDGATAFLRAAQSGDVELMRLLLAHGADPKIATADDVTALAVAAGIGWVEGVTFEWSPEENLEAVRLCLELGIDPNAADNLGRTALHGAAHKGRNAVIQLLVDHGGDLAAHDNGSRDTIDGAMKGWTWIPLHYSQGLVRVGVQSAIAHPETAAFIKKLMAERHLDIPPDITGSVCLTKGIKGCQ